MVAPKAVENGVDRCGDDAGGDTAEVGGQAGEEPATLRLLLLLLQLLLLGAFSSKCSARRSWRRCQLWQVEEVGCVEVLSLVVVVGVTVLVMRGLSRKIMVY